MKLTPTCTSSFGDRTAFVRPQITTTDKIKLANTIFMNGTKEFILTGGKNVFRCYLGG